jgi:3-hydroxyisobutyrate dehydrogenase
MKIGFIGQSDEARQLIHANEKEHEVLVLPGHGAEATGPGRVVDADTFARESDIVITSFESDSDLAAFLEEGGLASSLGDGTLVVDLTIGSADLFRDLTGDAKASGVILMDVNFTGHFETDGKPSRTIVAAGPNDAYNRIAPLLRATGFEVYYCGDAGNARALHLVNTTISVSKQIATLEVVAMGQKLGLTVDTMAKVINSGSGRNMTSRVVLPALVADKSFSSFPMEKMLDTLSVAVAEGDHEALPMITASITRGLLQAGIHRFGDEATMDDSVTLVENFANAKLAS